ncbi:MAG: type II secretion system F family protein [Methanobacteriota archaeon]|nr:MAG: type II secretion system F family protein [Euryarchaeota archaeon]
MVSKQLEEAKVKLYQKKDRTQAIVISGVIAFVILFLIAVLNLINPAGTGFFALRPPDPAEQLTPWQLALTRFLTWMTFAVIALVAPYGFFLGKKQRDIKAIERRLPDFLRDVAEAGRFGMTLAEAIVVSSSGRYGTLTPEIKKMAAQINWGVPATEALRLFSERVKTPMVGRVVSIIVKSSDAGGDVADVLTMVSHDAKETQLTEDERRITMSTYIAVIYISFLVFIVTIWILNATFLPKMREASSSLGASSGGGGLSAGQSPLAQDLPSVIFNIKIAFFIAVFVHGLGDGILAGVLDNGKIPNGLKHSVTMLLIAVIGFQFI